eukprot:4174283-Amphidinium_carterae.1
MRDIQPSSGVQALVKKWQRKDAQNNALPANSIPFTCMRTWSKVSRWKCKALSRGTMTPWSTSLLQAPCFQSTTTLTPTMAKLQM